MALAGPFRNGRNTQRASRAVAAPPIIHYPREQVSLTPVEIKTPPLSSDTEGLGKSPGHRYPRANVFIGLRGYNPVTQRVTWPMRHVLPKGREAERQGTNTVYLTTYLQGNRHAWPGMPGKVIETKHGVSLTSIAAALARQKRQSGG